MACPRCRCVLAARSRSDRRALVCADCGHPLLRSIDPQRKAQVIGQLLTGLVLAVAGSLALILALLNDQRLQPEAPVQEVSLSAPGPIA